MSETIEQEIERLRQLMTPRLTKYIPSKPTPKQAAFLLLPHREAFYGGAAGGGKSEALLMGALQYVDQPDFHALLLRRTYSDLSLPGALMDRAESWLRGTDARWVDKDKTWKFPSGASLTFGYLEHEGDKYRYQSSEFQYIGFDELTQFTETMYTYLFSRLRRKSENGVPGRMRGAANPGGQGHQWVHNRFLVEGRKKGRIFVPAGLVDNPHLQREEYEENLQELDPVTRAQLLHGDWNIREQGNLFKRQWFKLVDELPRGAKRLRLVRYWDLAATEEKKGEDPDYTAGVKFSLCEDGNYYVEDVVRFRGTPAKNEQVVRLTALQDGKTLCSIWMEQEPGSAGVNNIDNYRRHVLRGCVFRGDKPTGSKVDRSRPVSAAAENRLIRVVKAPWNDAFFDELEAFPTDGAHKDQVDALSGAFSKVAKRSRFYDGVRRNVNIWS